MHEKKRKAYYESTRRFKTQIALYLVPKVTFVALARQLAQLRNIVVLPASATAKPYYYRCNAMELIKRHAANRVCSALSMPRQRRISSLDPIRMMCTITQEMDM